ncbi:MAG: hypothetical protein M1818_004927 [Claussenomyces sp. TS43310]|nr:MAG: hypothetical protein M1818_004927 [Claussenomyces sp. TS43310]
MPVWFITGCSSGFGSEIAKAALKRGDDVIATARNADKLSELKALGALTLSLDITSPMDKLSAAVEEGIKAFGTIDILVNNAGYILQGAIEEASLPEMHAQFNTNFFGHMALTQAVLPHMRAQRRGVIANVGSIAGRAGGAGFGYYAASKFALAGATESLAAEVAHLGIRAVLIEPGYFRSNFLGADARVAAARRIPDFDAVMDPLRDFLHRTDRTQPGDVVKGAGLIVEALTGSARCEGKVLPARLLVGRDAVRFVDGVLLKSKRDVDQWAELSSSTDHDDVQA